MNPEADECRSDPPMPLGARWILHVCTSTRPQPMASVCIRWYSIHEICNQRLAACAACCLCLHRRPRVESADQCRLHHWRCSGMRRYCCHRGCIHGQFPRHDASGVTTQVVAACLMLLARTCVYQQLSIPSGTQYISSSPRGTLSGSTLTWNLGSLSALQLISWTVGASVNVSGSEPVKLVSCELEDEARIRRTAGQVSV
jgi:hypothetical protein